MQWSSSTIGEAEHEATSNMASVQPPVPNVKINGASLFSCAPALLTHIL